MATASATHPPLPPTLLSPKKKKSARLTLWPLVAATFFMVSGGTYGTEDIVHGAGYGRGILILLLTPLLWSLPTAYMIGELSSAIPVEGGYYAWVRRGLGNMFGFQEAWLSLVASIFDMAIYPTLFVAYLTRLFPWFAEGHRGYLVSLAIVAVCAIMNIAGIRVVAICRFGCSFCCPRLSPWSSFSRHLSMARSAVPQCRVLLPQVGFIGGMLIAMWNYMGWDNASTIAAEVSAPSGLTRAP